MSDLFHEDVPTHYIADVWNIIRQCPQHTFQVLTKRPYPMLSILSDWNIVLPNIWLGVSIENQATANERIPLLLQTPAAVRFVSYEPALGAVDLREHLPRIEWFGTPATGATGGRLVQGIDWVIVGGESGPGARPMHPDWARSVRDQCQAAGVPFFFKQWGAYAPWGIGCCDYMQSFNCDEMEHKHKSKVKQPYVMFHVGKKVAGRRLDGREWNEMPEVVQ